MGHPVILFLHAANAINNEQAMRGEGIGSKGLPKFMQATADRFPFIVALPVATPGPSSLGWDRGTCFKSCMHLLDMIAAELGGDPSRIYALGESMGGGGVWALVGKNPERFAAVVPCGGHLTTDAAKTGQKDLVMANLLKKPIWVFHSADDDIAPVEESDKAVEELSRQGSSVKFTRYTSAGHA